MIRPLTLLYVLYFLFPLNMLSQTREAVNLELVTKDLEFDPGKINSLVYRITNNTGKTIKYQPYLTIPAGIKLISELRPKQIKANEKGILIVSVNIPERYKAGYYNLSLHIVAPSTPSRISAEINSIITVKEDAGLEIDLVEAPEFIRAGEIIEASYIVRNTGNTTQNIVNTAFNCFIEEGQRVRLTPGSSAIVKIVAQTDINLAYPSRKSFYIEAKGENNLVELKYGFVRVIPVKIKENDLFHRFPVTLTSRYLAKGREGNYVGGYQFEASGKGTIDPEGKHHIEFIARGPNQFDLSLLGLYDEYFFSYSNKTLSVDIGDKSYSMTPLTEYARYGRGLEHKINITRFSQVGLLYLKPRFYKKFKSEYGAYANVGFFRENSIGVYFLRKLTDTSQDGINLFSATLNLHPFEKTSIELEASQGEQDGNTDNAFRVNLNSQLKRFSLSAFYFHTGKNYPGYYTNSEFYSGYANYNINKWLTIGLSGRQDFLNAEQDTLYLSAPFSRQYQGLVNIKFGRRIFLKTYARRYERQDRSPLEKFHYKTNAVYSTFSHRMKKFGYSLEGEFGETKNYLLPPENNIKKTFRAISNVYFQPSHKYYFQGFVTYTNINSFIADQEDNWIFGLSASGNITEKLRASLHLQNTYSVEEYYRNRNLFQFNIDYQFLKRHKLSATSFYTIFQDEVDKPDYSFSISYSLSLGIPLKQIAEAGSIAGRIENTGAGKVKGIILYTGGQTAVSDENGVFSFKNLIPGNYTVLIDRSTLDIRDIPDIPTPIEIMVEGNQESQLNFGLTKAAQVAGGFELEEQADSGSDGEVFSIGHVVLELHRENESIRIISDNKGRFKFPLVRPGKWYLKIYSSSFDKQYSLEKDYFDFDLQPGEDKSVVITLKKKKRNIIFLNNNVNLSSGDK